MVSAMKSNEAKSNQPVDGDDFWLNASQPSLHAIWGNSEDDVYAELLETSTSRIGENDEHI
ncbi:MAG: hypothetical protein LC770_03355 [Acidobacteria bacterium]|nr:hypothetical protein [Acidobacteriota bacterium]